MSRFEKACVHLFHYEGGYVFDKNDSGGETKYGISKRSYPKLDIKHLTSKEAEQIYYDDFWLKGRFEEISDENIAIKLFDASVNMGISRAITCAQRALKSMNIVVDEDGLIGPRTISAINSADSKQLICALKSEIAGFYRLLIAVKPVNNKFLKGWLNRAYSDIYTGEENK